MTSRVEKGAKAPDFSLPANAGEHVALTDFAGRWLVLYFYPKDNTPGCTTEALDFTRLAGDFATAGAAILGISRDSPARHDKFIAKHDLGIPLASDEDGSVCDAYGVWVEKNLYGRKYMGIERTTFLIDPEGVIEHVWRKVRVKAHAQTVLATLQG